MPMLDAPTVFCALREHLSAHAHMPRRLVSVEQASAYVTPVGLKAWYRALFPNAGPTGRGEAVVSAPLVALKACSKWLADSSLLRAYMFGTTSLWPEPCGVLHTAHVVIALPVWLCATLTCGRR